MPRFQFSLGSLMLAVAVAAVFCASIRLAMASVGIPPLSAVLPVTGQLTQIVILVLGLGTCLTRRKESPKAMRLPIIACLLLLTPHAIDMGMNLWAGAYPGLVPTIQPGSGFAAWVVSTIMTTKAFIVAAGIACFIGAAHQEFTPKGTV